MAWIKIRTDLHEDTAVLRLSDIMSDKCPTNTGHAADIQQTNATEIVGLLVRFWSWVDRQTADGTGINVSRRHIDALVGKDGFAEALCSVGWLDGDEGAFRIPNFQRHNGASAKARALEAEAKQLRRKMSDKCPTKKAKNVRPEKRREEKKCSPPTSENTNGVSLREEHIDGAKLEAAIKGYCAAADKRFSFEAVKAAMRQIQAGSVSQAALCQKLAAIAKTASRNPKSERQFLPGCYDLIEHGQYDSELSAFLSGKIADNTTEPIAIRPMVEEIYE
jgi:hypothetical protein